jgi:hypothetical protein
MLLTRRKWGKAKRKPRKIGLYVIKIRRWSKKRKRVLR